MHSGEGGGKLRRSRQTNEEAELPSSTETADQPAAETQNEQPENERSEEQSQGLVEKECSSSLLLNPWDDDDDDGDVEPQQKISADADSPSKPQSQGEERQEQQTVGVPIPSPPSSTPPLPSCFSSERERDKVDLQMPWWAGAFGAVPGMRDSQEARGFYARRFCEIFFPDNTAGATVVSRGWTAKSLPFA